jgi:hypothetical protein
MASSRVGSRRIKKAPIYKQAAMYAAERQRHACQPTIAPTDAPPGSDEKMDVMHQRQIPKRRPGQHPKNTELLPEDLFHPADADYGSDLERAVAVQRLETATLHFLGVVLQRGRKQSEQEQRRSA